MHQNEMFLLKMGEVVLKGLNRRAFEDKLMNNVRRRLRRIGSFQVYMKQSTIYVEPQGDCDLEETYKACRQIFGIAAVARAVPCEKTIEAIVETAKTYLAGEFANARAFKVESKRADKHFYLNSIQISQAVGGELAEAFPAVSVDVHKPDLTVYVEIREKFAYVHAPSESGAGGLPIGMGWMREGLWVAMALSNVARAYLRMGLSEASKYLYPSLNHASPFVTWCEERGAEAGSAKISGDKQHLWTPLSVCQYLTEALFYEDDEAVHICAGIVPEWLSEGKEIRVKGFYSHYGKTDFAVKNMGDAVSLKTQRKIEKKVLFHLPGEIRTYQN